MLTRMLGLSLFSPATLLLGGVGYAAYQQKQAGGSVLESGRGAARKFGELVGRATGRPVSEMQACRAPRVPSLFLPLNRAASAGVSAPRALLRLAADQIVASFFPRSLSRAAP
eukprot:5419061-Prymnesium_polylepis.2